MTYLPHDGIKCINSDDTCKFFLCLQQVAHSTGLSPYWEVETTEEFEDE
jgi:hypothetical protein